MDRKLIQDVYIRVCRDSGFRLDFSKAAQISGGALGIHPMTVSHAFPCIRVMEEIASGQHPASGGRAQ